MINVNASEIEALRRAIERLPDDIKVKAMAKALRGVTTVARNRLVARQSPRIKVDKGMIRELTTASFNAGGNTQSIVVKSGWLPLYKLGAIQTASGVQVRMRGSYKHAFIATMGSGHTGVFRRVGNKRFPIREQFGPNPAHDITNNPDVYIELVAEVVQEFLMPAAMREIEKVLPR